jgi:hypothetical protein
MKYLLKKYATGGLANSAASSTLSLPLPLEGFEQIEGVSDDFTEIFKETVAQWLVVAHSIAEL